MGMQFPAASRGEQIVWEGGGCQKVKGIYEDREVKDTSGGERRLKKRKGTAKQYHKPSPVSKSRLVREKVKQWKGEGARVYAWED